MNIDTNATNSTFSTNCAFIIVLKLRGGGPEPSIIPKNYQQIIGGEMLVYIIIYVYNKISILIIN